ncbi:hypothetical protein HHK36_014220 [Tetracentron sinense]|uniref:Dual specificity protein phosphatase DSP8 n=1 Tax=Tetracentron sinense TaxID=13715 RepID=A0A834Z7L6_TETSI|nr:hypothetical protein HHK36_014220 [Tetracentron sinense]
MKIEELEETESGGNNRILRRQIVRVDAKRALVGAGARILFYPTLLYNVFRNKIQAEFRWWDEVDQFLLLGAVPFPNDVPRLKQLGVGGVITLNEPYETLVPTSLYHAHGIDHLVIPTRDYLFAPSFVDISRAVDFIHRFDFDTVGMFLYWDSVRSIPDTNIRTETRVPPLSSAIWSESSLCITFSSVAEIPPISWDAVEYKHMTPAAALEYVRYRRPRVLLAPSQWKAVQDYGMRRLDGSAYSPSRDGVLITKADLEGYYGTCNDTTKELTVASRLVNATPMIARLSCLFASLKVSGGRGSVTRRLPEIRAC